MAVRCTLKCRVEDMPKPPYGYSLPNTGKKQPVYSTSRFWTPERLKVLKSLRDEGKDYNEIAEEFGCTPDACRRQWYKASGY